MNWRWVWLFLAELRDPLLSFEEQITMSQPHIVSPTNPVFTVVQGNPASLGTYFTPLESLLVGFIVGLGVFLARPIAEAIIYHVTRQGVATKRDVFVGAYLAFCAAALLTKFHPQWTGRVDPPTAHYAPPNFPPNFPPNRPPNRHYRPFQTVTLGGVNIPEGQFEMFGIPRVADPAQNEERPANLTAAPAAEPAPQAGSDAVVVDPVN